MEMTPPQIPQVRGDPRRAVGAVMAGEQRGDQPRQRQRPLPGAPGRMPPLTTPPHRQDAPLLLYTLDLLRDHLHDCNVDRSLDDVLGNRSSELGARLMLSLYSNPIRL